MPELPEVEAARSLLERSCVGKRIVKVNATDDDKVFCGQPPSELRRCLEGRAVLAARRKGKYLWLELEGADRPWPLMHFGMTGGIVVQNLGASKYKRIHLESDPDQWPPRFTKMEIDFEGGGKLAFVDARRFARIQLQVSPASREPLSGLGWDALSELPPPASFCAAVRQRCGRAPSLRLKALLLDQGFCCGLGNWTADEVLHAARMHPQQPAAALGDADLRALYGAVQDVVRQAVQAEADPDRFPKDWLLSRNPSVKSSTASKLRGRR